MSADFTSYPDPVVPSSDSAVEKAPKNLSLEQRLLKSHKKALKRMRRFMEDVEKREAERVRREEEAREADRIRREEEAARKAAQAVAKSSGFWSQVKAAVVKALPSLLRMAAGLLLKALFRMPVVS